MKYEIDSSDITFNGENLKQFFENINHAAEQCAIGYFVVGAFARDLILENIFGQPTGIATRDIDIAITIDNWDNYKAFTDFLIHHHQFKGSEVLHQYYSPENIYTLR